MKYFCIPADFKDETIDSYQEINCMYEHSKVYETYGQMAPEVVFGSCRVAKQLPTVDREKLERYIKYSKDRGIEFNYVINATCMANDELTVEGYNKIKDFLKLLEGIGVTGVTIALPSLMEIAKYVIPNVKIKASTVCQINSPLKAKFYEELGIGRIVLDEDIYRRFDILKDIRAVYNGDLEVIVNSFCSIDCPYKMFHYNCFSHSHEEKDTYPYYVSRCKSRHIGEESFMKLCWIRPEDIHYYDEIGIKYFKIQGRTNVYTGNPVKAVKHYIDGRYDGDFVRLLELFSPKRPLAIAEAAVDNRKLDGFFESFAKHPELCSKDCDKCGYCKSYGESAINSTDRAIMEVMKLMDKEMLKDFPRSMDKTDTIDKTYTIDKLKE